jgi:hypothetical protein
MEMVVNEYHTHPRNNMQWHLKRKLNKNYIKTPGGKLIIQGLAKAAKESEVKKGLRAPEGAYNVFTSVQICLEKAPDTAVPMAKTIKNRFDVLEYRTAHWSHRCS